MKQQNTPATKGSCDNLEHPTVVSHNIQPSVERHFMNDQKLSIPETAKVMGISPNSLRRIIEQGRLPVLKILKKTLILASDVEQFLQASRVSVRRVENTKQGLPALPAAVINSRHLRGLSL